MVERFPTILAKRGKEEKAITSFLVNTLIACVFIIYWPTLLFSKVVHRFIDLVYRYYRYDQITAFSVPVLSK